MDFVGRYSNLYLNQRQKEHFHHADKNHIDHCKLSICSQTFRLLIYFDPILLKSTYRFYRFYKYRVCIFLSFISYAPMQYPLLIFHSNFLWDVSVFRLIAPHSCSHTQYTMFFASSSASSKKRDKIFRFGSIREPHLPLIKKNESKPASHLPLIKN